MTFYFSVAVWLSLAPLREQDLKAALVEPPASG